MERDREGEIDRWREREGEIDRWTERGEIDRWTERDKEMDRDIREQKVTSVKVRSATSSLWCLL